MLKEAVKQAEKAEEVKRLRGAGCFLTSCMSILSPEQDLPSEWILIYYDLGANTANQVVVSAESVELRSSGPPLDPSTSEIELANVKTGVERALEIARGEFAKYKQPLAQVIVTLQREQLETWKMVFITKTLFAVSVRLNAVDGSVLSSEKTSLTGGGTPKQAQGTLKPAAPVVHVPDGQDKPPLTLA